MRDFPQNWPIAMLALLPLFALCITGIVALLAKAPKPRSTGDREWVLSRKYLLYEFDPKPRSYDSVYPFTHTSNGNRTTPQ